MRVQTKLLLLLLLIFVIFASGIALYFLSDAKRMRYFTSARNSELISILEKSIDLKSRMLDAFVRDYTFWDDMVNFSNSHDMSWAKENIELSLDTYKTDYAWVYKTDFSLIYSINRTPCPELKELPAPTDTLKSIFMKNKFCHFFAKIPDGIIEISGASIHPTNDNDRITPPNGYFFTGKLLDKDYLKDLSTFTASSITLSETAARKNRFNMVSRSGMLYYSKEIAGWDGRTLAFINGKYHSTPIEIYSRTAFTLVGSIVLFALSILALLSAFLAYYLNMPLRLVTSAIERENTGTLTRLYGKKDEFGKLANLIREYFKQKETQKKIESELIRARELVEKEKFETVIQHMESGIAVCGPDWQIKQINNSAKNYLSIKDDTSVNQNMLGLLAKRYDTSVPIEKLLDYTTGNRKFDITRKETDQYGALYIEVYVDIIKDPTGSITNIVCVFNNVTAARHEEIVKRDFLSLISHKLKTPIAIINQSSALLQEGIGGNLSKNQQALADAISRESLNLIDVFEKLLGFVTIEEQKLIYQKEIIPLKEYLNMLLTPLIQVEKSKKISLSMNCPADLNTEINKIYFDIIVGNLFDNAVKFNNKDIIEIHIAASRQGDRISISFSDNGPGIPPEEKDKIFEKFYQIEKYFTGNVRGAGLGLTIVKYLVEAHNGKIAVESELDKNTIFVFDLPAKAQE